MSESVSETEAAADPAAGYGEEDASGHGHGAASRYGDEDAPGHGHRAASGYGHGDASGYEPASPAPVNVPRTPTGHAEVDAQLDRLADADHLDTGGHLEVYEDVHRGLRDALTALDARPGPAAPGGHPAAVPR